MLKILIGTLSGIFSGIGMGGGTILIFLLNSFLGIEQHIAQATNLVYFVPTAISAIIVNYRNKKIGNYYIFIWNFWCNSRSNYFYKYRCRNFKKVVWNIFSNYWNS